LSEVERLRPPVSSTIWRVELPRDRLVPPAANNFTPSHRTRGWRIGMLRCCRPGPTPPADGAGDFPELPQPRGAGGRTGGGRKGASTIRSGDPVYGTRSPSAGTPRTACRRISLWVSGRRRDRKGLCRAAAVRAPLRLRVRLVVAVVSFAAMSAVAAAVRAVGGLEGGGRRAGRFGRAHLDLQLGRPPRPIMETPGRALASRTGPGDSPAARGARRNHAPRPGVSRSAPAYGPRRTQPPRLRAATNG